MSKLINDLELGKKFQCVICDEILDSQDEGIITEDGVMCYGCFERPKRLQELNFSHES